MDIIPLPYVKVFKNEKGNIEAQCNLNNAPKQLCELLASFLTNHETIPTQELRLVSSNETEGITEVQTKGTKYEEALKLYPSLINTEFRLTRDFEGRFSCKGSNVPHSKIIELAIRRKAVKALDDAINSPPYKKLI